MDPFDSSSEDDDFITNVFYSYYFDELDDDAILRTRSAAINRNRATTHRRLYRDYFADESVYDSNHFKRRFRLSRNLFMRICSALENR